MWKSLWQRKTQLAGKSTTFFLGCMSCWILVDLLLARVSLLGGKTCQPLATAPSPSLTAPITTRQHCTSRNRHGNWNRQGSERSHMVHMMRFSTDVVFFVLFLLVFFGQKWGKSWRFPKEQTYCLRQRAQVNTLSGRNTCLKGCNSMLIWMSVAWHLQNLHKIGFSSNLMTWHWSFHS